MITTMINFLYLNQELVTKDCNPRSITTFFNSISSIKNFGDDLPLISMLGDGSVGPEFSQMFAVFINNKLDKLITPSVMVSEKSWESVKKQMIDCIGSGDKYRADIAAVLSRRIVNYSQLLATNGKITKEITERLTQLTTEQILGADLQFYIVRALINGEKKERFAPMMNNATVANMMLK